MKLLIPSPATQVLFELGLADAPLIATRKPAARNPKPRPPRSPPPEAMRRRSSRVNRGGDDQADGSERVGRVGGRVESGDDAEEACGDAQMLCDSSVLRHICNAASQAFEHVELRTSEGGTSWHEKWSAGCLAPIYSIDSAAIVGSPTCLLASGGKGGMISLWDTSTDETDEDGPLLMQWRAGNSWVGDVRFCSHATAERTLLLSCANDAKLRLWDVNKSRGKDGAALLGQATPHHTGIFSLDERDGRVLTASKDKSVGLSLLRGSGVHVERWFDQLHCSVVKSVRWRNEHEFASAGNDSHVVICDSRGPGGPSLQLSDCHTRAINSLAWHPRDEFLLMSSGFDPAIYLHDLRKPHAPLFTYCGHSLKPDQRQIHQPSFCLNGGCIVAMGDGSHLLST